MAGPAATKCRCDRAQATDSGHALLARELQRIADKPALIVRGTKDFAFRDEELAHFERTLRDTGQFASTMHRTFFRMTPESGLPRKPDRLPMKSRAIDECHWRAGCGRGEVTRSKMPRKKP